MNIQHYALALISGLSLVACGAGAPPAGRVAQAATYSGASLPLSGADAVCFYEDVNYQGRSFCVPLAPRDKRANAGLAVVDVAWVGDDWNDKISSLRIRGDVFVDLYEDVSFQYGSTGGIGRARVNTDLPSLERTPFAIGTINLNDAVSSFKVTRPAR